MPDPTSDIQSSWLANYFATHPMGGADSAFNIGGGMPGGGFAGLADAVVPAPVTAPAPTPQAPSIPLRPAAPSPLASLETGLPPMPAAPRKIPVPEPPAPQYTDPMKALGKPMSLLALIASSFVRNPAIAAGNAMAAAMEAQRKGDQVHYQNAYREYQQQMQKVAREQEQENEEYTAAYNNRKLSYDERIAQLRMKAARRQDSIMTQLLGGGGPMGQGGTNNVDEAVKLMIARGRSLDTVNKVLKAEKIMHENPGMTFTQAMQKAISEATEEKDKSKIDVEKEKQKLRVELRQGLTGNKAADIKQRDAIADEALDKIDSSLQILNKYRMAAGLAGKAFRGIEIVGNITGADVATDRVQMRRDLQELMILYPRVLGGSRPLAMDAKHIEDVIGGLGVGDTTLNTIRSMEELRNTLMRFKQTNKGILQQGGQGGPAAAPPAEAPPAEIDWSAFPKAE